MREVDRTLLILVLLGPAAVCMLLFVSFYSALMPLQYIFFAIAAAMIAVSLVALIVILVRNKTKP